MAGQLRPPALLAIACCALFWLTSAVVSAQEIEFDEESIAAQGTELVADLEKQTQASPPGSSDPQELCIFFHRRGWAHFRLGNYDLAVNDLRQAFELNRPNRLAPDDWCNRWRILKDLKQTHEASGDWFGSIDLIRGISTEETQNDPLRKFSVQLMLIQPYLNLGMRAQAGEALTRAGEILPTLRAQKKWRKREHSVMSTYYRFSARLMELQGKEREAEQLWRQSVEHAEQSIEAKEARFSKKNRGEFGKGSQKTRSAQENYQARLLDLAANLVTQGKLGEAEYYARKSLQDILASYAFKTSKTSGALSVLARIKLENGSLGEAERLFRLSTEAIEGASVKSYSTRLAALRGQIGFVLCAQERWEDAIKVFEDRDRGLRSNPEQFKRLRSNHMDWAMALYRTGHAAEAEAMLKRMLGRNADAAYVDPGHIAQLKGYLGIVLAGGGKTGEALALFRAALPDLVKPTGAQEGGDNGGFTRLFRLRLILEGYLDLLASLSVGEQAPAGRDSMAEAFTVADMARFSSVQNALAASLARAQLPDPDLAQLARQEQDISHRLQAAQKLLMDIAGSPHTDRLAGEISRLRQEIEQLQEQRKSLMSEILRRFPAYAELLEPQAATLVGVQKALRENEAAIAIYSGERRSYVWTVTGSRASFRVVDMPRKMLSLYVGALRQGLDFRHGRTAAFDLALDYRLYEKFLAPDASLWKSATLVNIIPHGPLAQIPFSLLLTHPPRQDEHGEPQSHREHAWLIKQTAIAQQPSASAFLALRAAASGARAEQLPFIGFGNPLFSSLAATPARDGASVRSLRVAPTKDETMALIDAAAQETANELSTEGEGAHPLAYAFRLLAPLPDTAEELQEISRITRAESGRDLFMGEKASEKNVKSAPLSQYRAVAFATHGLTPGELPGLDQPALAMANPKLADDAENDGFLTMDEVLGLRLNAEWVILSACNTASAGGKGSEAVSGLGRAFFYAGTRSLLVSNWAVESVSARLLTTRVFALQSDRPALARAEALRLSMLALMNTPKAETDYSHPAFWAPFSLVGDGIR